MAEFNLGAYRMKFTGDWDPNKEYYYMNVVNYNGSKFIYINAAPSTSIIPEGETNSENYWECIAHKGEKGDTADVYQPYIEVINGEWDFAQSDKILIPDNAITDTIGISNIYNGACGIIITRKELQLPQNSFKSKDFNYTTLVQASDMYFYTFTYTKIGGILSFVWHRTVISRDE